MYEREGRDLNLVPESKEQLLKFTKEQNKELLHFIQETTESDSQPMEETETEMHLDDIKEHDLGLIFSDEDDISDVDDMILNAEWEF